MGGYELCHEICGEEWLVPEVMALYSGASAMDVRNVLESGEAWWSL